MPDLPPAISLFSSQSDLTCPLDAARGRCVHQKLPLPSVPTAPWRETNATGERDLRFCSSNPSLTTSISSRSYYKHHTPTFPFIFPRPSVFLSDFGWFCFPIFAALMLTDNCSSSPASHHALLRATGFIRTRLQPVPQESLNVETGPWQRRTEMEEPANPRRITPENPRNFPGILFMLRPFCFGLKCKCSVFF